MKNKKILNKLIAVLCVLAIACTFLLPNFVYAEEKTEESESETTTGEKKQTAKAEVIYASLDTRGKAEDIYVVNNFPADTDQNLVDYGDYSEIEDLALSGSAKLNQDQVEISKVAENYYYKGKLNSAEIPWIFNITYTLDGQEIPAEELADQSGDFRLNIEVEANPEMKRDNIWAQNLMLQITVQLPNDVAQNVKSEQGIVAEAGSNKLITFMFLPNAEVNRQSKTYSVEAVVQHFSMPSIQIVASPFSLNMFQFDLPDLSENEEVQKFQEATKDLATGTKALSDGITELNDGKQKLVDNLDLITSSGDDLTNGGTDLTNGINQYIDGVDQISVQNQKLLNGAAEIQKAADQILFGFQSLSAGGELIKGSEEIQNGLSVMQAGAGQLTPEQITAIKTQLNALPDQVAGFKQSITELMTGLDEIKTNLSNIIAGLNGIQTALSREAILGQLGINETQIVTNVEAQSILAYVESVAQGFPTLIAGLTQINDGLTGMQNSDALAGMNSALDNLSQLSKLSGLLDLLDGINQLNSQYTLFHSGLYEYVQGFNQLSAGFYNENDSNKNFYSGLSAYLQGVQQYVDGVSTLSNNGTTLKNGLSEYVSGTDQYVSGVKSWADGFNTFASGIDAVNDGALELANGTGQLSEGTQEIDKMMNQMINSYLADYDREVEIPSFASAKNDTPETVQFVFMTEAINKEKTEKITEPEQEKETFWDRLFNLFR